MTRFAALALFLCAAANGAFGQAASEFYVGGAAVQKLVAGIYAALPANLRRACEAVR